MKTKRIKTQLEPGLRYVLKQTATGETEPPEIHYSEAAAVVFHQQINCDQKWNPDPILKRWNYTPASPAKDDEEAPTVTPGLVAGSRLDAIVEGLHCHCAVLNAPLYGVPVFDGIVTQMRAEVSVLLLAAGRELERIREAFRTQFGFCIATFNLSVTAPGRLEKAMEWGKYPAPAVVLDFAFFLQLCGLLRLRSGVIQFATKPSADAPDEIVHVPVGTAADQQLVYWSQATGLEKKRLVAAILTSGAAGQKSPDQELDALLEFAILDDALDMVRKMFDVFSDYDSRLNGEPCPYPDPELLPFIKQVQDKMQSLRQQGEALELVISTPMAARWSPRHNTSASLCANAAATTTSCFKLKNKLDAPARLKLSEFLEQLNRDEEDE